MSETRDGTSEPAVDANVGGICYADLVIEALGGGPGDGTFRIPEHVLFRLLCEAYEAGRKSK